MKKVYRITKGCTICATCVYECPRGAISIGRNGAVIDEDTCIGCGACYENCASEAIEVIETDPAKL